MNGQNDSKIKIEELSEENLMEDDKQRRWKKKSTLFKRWGNLQKLRYMIFLIKYQEFLESDNICYKMLWGQKMAVYICETQNCYSCHKTYLKQFKSIQGIINHLKKTVFLEKEVCEKEYLRLKEVMKNFQPKIIKKIDFQNGNDLTFQNPNITRFQGKKEEFINFLQFPLDQKNIQHEKKQGGSDSEPQISIDILMVIRKQQEQQSQISQYQKKRSEEIIEKFKNNLMISVMTSIPAERINSKFHSRQKQLQIQNVGQEMPIQTDSQIKRENSNSTRKFKKITKASWSKSENLMTMIFLNMEREKFKSRNKNSKTILFQKLSEYVNTDKRPSNFRRHIERLLTKYNKNFEMMLEQETKRLGISKELIESEKIKKVYFTEKNYNCQIHLQPQKIEYQINFQDLQVFSREKQTFEVPIQFDVILKQMIRQIKKNQNAEHKKDLGNSQSNNKSQTINQANKKIHLDEANQKSIKTILKLPMQPNLFKILSRIPKDSENIQKMKNLIFIHHRLKCYTKKRN